MNDFSFLSENNDSEEFHFLYSKLKNLDVKIANEFNRRISELYTYTAIAENPTDFNDEANRLNLFGKMSYGFRKAGEGYTWAKVLNKEYTRMLSETEADIKINEYPKWLQEQQKTDPKFKSTEDYKKTYVCTVDTYQNIMKLVILTDSMIDEFATIRTELMQSISTIKAICYGFRDSSVMSSTAVGI